MEIEIHRQKASVSKCIERTGQIQTDRVGGFAFIYNRNQILKLAVMDIEFVQEEHRQNIFKIMELCGCDLAEAYELYQNNSCNVEAAIQAKFNPPQDTYSPSKFQPVQRFNTLHEEKFQNDRIGSTDEYENYRIFKESGVNFTQKYNVRKEGGYFNIKGMLGKMMGSNDHSLKRQLEQFIGRKINLKHNTGSLSESLESVWKSKFPLVVHLLDFSLDSKQQLKAFYGNQEFVEMLNTQFQNYVLDTRNYQLEQYLKEFLDLKNDANSLIVMRVNAIDQITLVSKISWFKLSLSEVKKKLKQVKSNCINVEMQESYLEKKYGEELRGNFDYVKPMSLAEKRKLKEDRQIRKKQEEEFFKAMQPKKQTETNSKHPPQHSPQHFAQKSQNGKKPFKETSIEAVLARRKKTRDSLKSYSGEERNCIAIKLRLPSSKTMTLNVGNQEPASYLYEYVESREQNMGFEDESRRDFDIIEPYEKINLSSLKGKSLGQIFEGQDMLSLVVSEKTE